MYFADSLTRQIVKYRYDSSEGSARSPELFVDTSALHSAPDGATLDSEGCLWVCLPQAGKIARLSRDGSTELVIDMPVQHVSCLCFGGPDLATLYVTSISDSGNMFRDDHPLAGAMFSITGHGAVGLPESRFID
jgi:sugar lactone lactonase YvrE